VKIETYRLCLEGGNIPFYFAEIKAYAFPNVEAFVLEHLKVIHNIIIVQT
jgi:hypothetical protein